MRRIVVFTVLCSSLLFVAPRGWCQFSPSALSPETGIANPILQRIGTPVFHASWAATGAITARASASGSLNQSLFQFIFPFSTTQDRVTSGNGDGKLEFDARGFWFGATIPVRLADSLTWNTRGEYFVPLRDRVWASANGTSSRSTTNTLSILGVPFLTTGPFTSSDTGVVELDATVRTNWFFIDMEFAYSGLSEGTSILAGVRYDRLLSSIGPTVLPPNITIPVPASVTAELNSVCPYLGLRTQIGGPFRGVTFEIKGIPTVIFTNARYTAQNGYFAEFKGEYYGSLANNLLMSLFIKGDIIHATFTELTDFTRLFTVEGAIPFSSVPPGFSLTSQNSSAEVSTSVHWSQLSLGGSFVLSF